MQSSVMQHVHSLACAVGQNSSWCVGTEDKQRFSISAASCLLTSACAVLQVFEGIRDFIVQAVELKVSC
jgi:hypothetical protein